eukprot:1357826-Rhodomonas_salina.4
MVPAPARTPYGMSGSELGSGGTSILCGTELGHGGTTAQCLVLSCGVQRYQHRQYDYVPPTACLVLSCGMVVPASAVRRSTEAMERGPPPPTRAARTALRPPYAMSGTELG